MMMKALGYVFSSLRHFNNAIYKQGTHTILKDLPQRGCETPQKYPCEADVEIAGGNHKCLQPLKALMLTRAKGLKCFIGVVGIDFQVPNTWLLRTPGSKVNKEFRWSTGF
jgi:hypothetical protein